MQFDRYGELKPAVLALPDEASAAFARLCPFSPHAINEDDIAARRFPGAARIDPRIGRFEAAFIGHVVEGAFRKDGSSGGLTSWVAAEALRRGLVDAVIHVAPADPADRLFRYRVSRKACEIQQAAKSRYYPVDLAGMLREVRRMPGRYAVIGVPCFIKAAHLACAQDEVLRERVVLTLGLFCGHMKSARMVESFAWQMGETVSSVAAIDYRRKDPQRPANWYRAALLLRDGRERSADWWSFVDGDWGAGFFQNSACNFCDDVVAETADMSFGDAWIEPYASDGRGANVVILRAPVLLDLVRAGMAEQRLSLTEIDADTVHETQAAGFRHRREGLAWRLARRRGLMPRKRVAPLSGALPARRRAVYWLRGAITVWSRRIFYLARLTRSPALYLLWARAALRFYQGVTWSRGRIGRFVDRLEAFAARR